MRIGVLSKYAMNGWSRNRMEDRLCANGFTSADTFVWLGIAPSNEDCSFTRAELKDFRAEFLERDLAVDGLLLLGNEALYVATGHSGIMKWRGKEELLGKYPVIPSLSPSAVSRNPSQGALLDADIRALYRAVYKISDRNVVPAKINKVTTRAGLEELKATLADADAVAFDLETSSFDELDPEAFIVSIALTTIGSRGKHCFSIPLCHRASVWRTKWKEVLQKVTSWMREVPWRVAHNAKFDCRWLVQFDAAVPCNFDTMLAAHLLDENRQKSLKALAPVLLNAPAWDIGIKGGKNALPWYLQHKLSDTLEYNGLDTWHTMGLYELFRPELEEDPRLWALFTKLMMPASQSLVHIERRGVFVDREALEEGARIVRERLEDIDRQLTAMVPEDRRQDVNWNPSGFLRWFLFEHLELPVLQKGKTGPSVAEGVLSHLKNEHPAIPLLLERVSWQKHQSAFFNPYRALITDDDRLHTTFKLSGTVTGRLSSGKADTDKVTGGSKSKLRGVNLQQVPRDKLVRGIFGAAPGWTFVEADYSQIELRIAAEVAQEPTMLHLYATGQDIHMTMAMRMTGKPQSEVTAEERKKAKAVNFGFLYGMGANKFIETAWNNYGLEVSEHEAQAFRTAFFDQFPELRVWHGRQRKLARKYRRVQSPLGRIRHLPDVVSEDRSVVSEAERQAINSPVQAMASDLCLLSLVLLDRAFRRKGMRSAPIGTVHDAINFEIPDDELEVALPLIKRTMENPPIQQLFGYQTRVPIVSDVCVGRRWGSKVEVPADTVLVPDELHHWLKENHL